MSLASDVGSHVLDAFEYLDDVLEPITVERLSPELPDPDTGQIPTAPELHTVMAYVVRKRFRSADDWQPGDIGVVFRTKTLPFAMEASCFLQRGDGRKYSVVEFDTTAGALTIVHARSA